MTLLEFARFEKQSGTSVYDVAQRVEAAYKFFDPNFALDPTDQVYYSYYLYQLVRFFKPRRIVQTGTFTGVSAVAMLLASFDAGSPAVIDSIDPEPNFYHHTHNPVSIARQVVAHGKWEERIHFLKGYSCAAPAGDPLPGNLLASLSPDYDLFLVDGDHSFKGALGDLENGMSALRNGKGIIVVHDYNGIREVRAAVDFWRHKHPGRISHEFSTSQPCGLGIFQLSNENPLN